MQPKDLIAQVIVDHNSYQTDRLFDYIIPPELQKDLLRGMRVIVPFGKGNKRLEAYVMNIEEKCVEGEGYKVILDILDASPVLSSNQIKMIFWMRNKYLCKYIEGIRCFLPPGIIHKEKYTLRLREWPNGTPPAGLSPREEEILNCLTDRGGTLPMETLERLLSFKDPRRTLRAMEAKGLLTMEGQVTARVEIKTETYCQLTLPPGEEGSWPPVRGAKQQEIIAYLQRHGKSKVATVLAETATTRAPLKALVDRGIVTLLQEEIKRNPLLAVPPMAYPKLPPSEEQRQVIDRISASIEKNEAKTYLIHGVTGSGKTEIYLQLIEAVLQQGKQGIVLVPEISLTPQTVERFRGRFGEGIALIHSQLSEGERYDEWRRIQEGKANIVIGARSAIFAPLDRLGMIIIDEEHESTYKSEQSPKYHGVEVAQYRGQQERAVVVLGTATPSLETYYQGQMGAIEILTLRNRVTNAPLPKVKVVDMRKQVGPERQGILSEELILQMRETLKRKEQIILFLNRRGYATVVACPDCGEGIRCSRCDITMTYHLRTQELKCHYCGEIQTPPKACPHCGSQHLRYQGTGTQRLEELIERLFPGVVAARLDLDSTGKKGAHEKILRAFREGEIQILIGTQMISKGLDFPNVTLVGIISADSTLNLPDFRGAEKTFQLITQVAGRAGRGDREGLVVLQTHTPEHYSIKAAINHDYLGFYQEELALRKAFHYPPFVQLYAINFSGKEWERVAAYSQKIGEMMAYVLKNKGIADPREILLGPNEAVIPKINQQYRYQILLKSVGVDSSLLKSLIKYFFIQHRQKYVPKDITVTIDLNPYHMM